jgi:hypothetical protein
MLKGLFGAKKSEAQRGEDAVWISHAARRQGITREVAALAGADSLGPNAHITFHLSLEDKLLQEFAGSIQPLLEKLGLSPEEPITNSMVTRSIKNAQEKRRG